MCKRVACSVRSTFGWRRRQRWWVRSLSAASLGLLRGRGPPFLAVAHLLTSAVQPAWLLSAAQANLFFVRDVTDLCFEPHKLFFMSSTTAAADRGHGGSIDQQVRWWWWDRARLRKTRHCRDRRHPPPAPTSPEQTKASSVRLPAAGEARVENSELHISSGSKVVERVRQRERGVQPICVVGVPERDGGVREREQGGRMAPMPRSPVKGRGRGRGARRGAPLHQGTQLW